MATKKGHRPGGRPGTGTEKKCKSSDNISGTIDRVKAGAVALRAELEGLLLEDHLPDLVPRLLGPEHVKVLVPQGVPLRVHPTESMQAEVFAVARSEGKGQNEIFLRVPDEVVRELEPLEEITGLTLLKLYAAVTAQGEECLLRVKLPILGRPSGPRSTPFEESLTAATDKWCVIRNNGEHNKWAVLPVDDDLPEPSWSGRSMGELLDAAFAGHTIESAHDRRIRRRRGTKRGRRP